MTIGPMPPRSSLSRFMARERERATEDELYLMRRAAWRKQGVVVLRPEDIRDDWTRQVVVNEAVRLYGPRPKDPPQ